jgi:hypothetical protein
MPPLLGMYPPETFASMSPLKLAMPTPKSSAVDSMPKQYLCAVFVFAIFLVLSLMVKTLGGGIHIFIWHLELICTVLLELIEDAKT